MINKKKNVLSGEIALNPGKKLKGCFVKGVFILTCCYAVPVLSDADKAQKIQFNLPSADLASALNRFAEQTGMELSYPTAMVAGLKAKPLKGGYSIQEGMSELLQGTGLTYRMTGGNSVTLQKVTNTDTKSDSVTLKEMTVTGESKYDATDPYDNHYAVPNSSFATKTDTLIMETPLNIQVLPKAVLDDQQATRIDQAVKLVSGVTTGQGAGGLSDQITIRGFFNNNYFRNGMRIDTNGGSDGTRAMANVQSLEVLKGPAAMLYGRVEPGGMVNVVTKKPLETAYYSVQQQAGSYDFYRTSIDATGPLTNNKDLLYRMNVSYENSGSFREFVDSEKVFVAPVLQWNISPQTQAILEMEYRHENNSYDPGAGALIIDGKRANGTWINPRLAKIPRERNLIEPDNKNPLDNEFIGFSVNHQFNDDWTLSEQLGINLLDRTRTAMNSGALNADKRTLNRQLLTSDFYTNDSYFTTTNLTGHFDTWGLKHTLLVGGDYYLQDENSVGYSSTVPSTIDIYNPVYTGLPAVNPTTRASQSFHSTTDLYGIYLQDQIKLPYNVHVMGGFRYQYVEQYNVLTKHIGQKADAVTPQVGLLWQPIKWLSLYGNYVENFGATNGQGQNGTFLPPQTAQQWEGGFKTSFFDDRLSTTIAYFNLTKQNIPTIDPANQTFSIATGEAQSRGVEVDVRGEILPGWNAIATYAYTETEVLKENNPNSIPVGSPLRGIPKNTSALWTTYDFQQDYLRGFKVGAGVDLYSSRKATFNYQDFDFAGYGVVNLLGSYTRNVAKTKVTLQLNVNNLLDKEYIHDGFIQSNSPTLQTRTTWGTPRTLMGSVKVEF
ncbi:TonB-dependent receptor [Methylobacter sp. S3L5C]|uniref:TonB-dependent siderophore receptor n=1 Tax=Methylobacter sp. S3L5C TaxID=2839024 RepID=UPI001FADCF83|nr:TonB-dependent receptor [Methylobacter sp. S3L5C]UOA09646.1 TonB-dependent receptor [Methylobacter sp. S3L5C]